MRKDDFLFMQCDSSATTQIGGFALPMLYDSSQNSRLVGSVAVTYVKMYLLPETVARKRNRVLIIGRGSI